jgi:hypothetical protein
MPALLHRPPQDVAAVSRPRVADRAAFPEFPVHALHTRCRVCGDVAVVVC